MVAESEAAAPAADSVDGSDTDSYDTTIGAADRDARGDADRAADQTDRTVDGADHDAADAYAELAEPEYVGAAPG